MYDERILSSQSVVIPVTEVIHDEQRINHQSTGYGSQEHLPRDRMQLDIIAAADGHDAKEQEHQRITQALIGKERRIKESEDHAQHTHENHLQTAIVD